MIAIFSDDKTKTKCIANSLLEYGRYGREMLRMRPIFLVKQSKMRIEVVEVSISSVLQISAESAKQIISKNVS